MAKKKVILIGCGNRGKRYTDVMKDQFSDYFEVVAVAEPIEARRNYAKQKHGLSDDVCFETWQEMFKSGKKLADVAVVATMDRDHYAPTMAAIEQGYDILLEKPVAPTPEECRAIERAAEKKGVFVLVCHVLRFAKFYLRLKEILDSGILGKLISIQHIEAVDTKHNSHSFVRGKWGNSDRSSPMILQKTCHDFDLIAWLTGEKCTKLHSFGMLSYYKRENAPEGSPERCIEGCPYADTCEYNAVKIYCNDKVWMGADASRKFDPTDEDIVKALWETQFGKCIFKCDNNVVDHQIVDLVYGDDICVSFTLCSFTEGGRVTRIMGTQGEIFARAADNTIEFYDFKTQEKKSFDIGEVIGEGIVDGHGGGDSGIVMALRDLVEGDIKSSPVSRSVCEISESCDNHMISFAAEESRLTGKAIDMKEYNSRF